jgi:hypothetical protein
MDLKWDLDELDKVMAARYMRLLCRTFIIIFTRKTKGESLLLNSTMK